MTDTQSFDPRMVEFLVCPLTHQRLRLDRNAQELISERANLAFPIRDGIPILLEAEARILDER